MMFKKAKETAIPAIGLGTWQMKGKECVEGVKQALDLGYRHVDTAQMYKNEEAVGQGIKESSVDRKDIFLTTKIWYTDLKKDQVVSAVDQSLERLQTDYVDLLLIHWPSQETPLEETLEAFKKVKDQGKAKSIGVSNFTPELLEKALDIAPGLVNHQVEMHTFYQQREMVRYCQENDLTLTAYSPLARERVLEDPVLNEIGEKYDKSPAQIALRWLIQQENVIAIPKAVPEDYQRQNLEAMDFELDEEDMRRIFDIEQKPKIVDPGFAPW